MKVEVHHLCVLRGPSQFPMSASPGRLEEQNVQWPVARFMKVHIRNPLTGLGDMAADLDEWIGPIYSVRRTPGLPSYRESSYSVLAVVEGNRSGWRYAGKLTPITAMDGSIKPGVIAFVVPWWVGS